MTAPASATPKNEGTTLNVTRSGQSVVIQAIHAGRDLRGRLAALGLLNGVQVRVIRAGQRNPTVIGLHGARIVLGRGMAERIEVAAAPVKSAAAQHG